MRESEVIDMARLDFQTNAVIGRACAIAAEKKSFDLCDDSEGLGVGKILSDPEYLQHFGYGPLVEQRKKDEEASKANGETAHTEPEKSTEEAKPVKEAKPETKPAPNGITAEAPIADPATVPAIEPLVVTPEVPAKAEVVVPVTQPAGEDIKIA
jgi:hypothetical protein